MAFISEEVSYMYMYDKKKIMPPYYLGICCALYIKVDVRLHLNDQYKE